MAPFLFAHEDTCMPRGYPKSKAIEPMEMDTTKMDDITLPTSGPLNLETTVIEQNADIIGIKEKAEALAFNEEKIVIMIHESTDPNAENPVPLGNNGRMVYLNRGEEYRISRKYAERLCLAKAHGVRTAEVRDANGDRTTKVVRTAALAYPFSVLQDNNPKGREWLQSLMQQS